MPEPALTFWIIGAPFVFAVIDLVRTVSSLKNTPHTTAGRGAWSQALHVGKP